MRIPLIDRYRPASFGELVLPPNHGLAEAVEFLREPYPSCWLIFGPPGIGKTSLARIMAKAAAHDEMARQTISGPNLTIDRVREIEQTVRQRPLPSFGRYHAYVIDEADSVPKAAQVLLLHLLEDIQNSVIIFSSNDSLDEFESRFVSRVKLLPFTVQGLCGPASEWLAKIAAAEGVDITRKAAERIIKDSRSNMRAALQVLDTKRAEAAAKGLLAPPMVLHPTVPNTEIKSKTVLL